MYTKNYKHSYVYKITNKLSGEYYIGLRSCDCPIDQDAYMGSGIRIKHCINKYGIENFSKEILGSFSTRPEASDAEALFVTEEVLEDPLCLNLRTGGEYIYDVKYHPIACTNISNGLKSYFINDPDAITKLSQRTKAYYDRTPEARVFVSDMRKRVCADPEHVAKVKAIRRKLHDETDLNKKIKESLNKPEVKEKRSKAAKSYAATEIGQANLSMATKGSVYINKDGETKRVQKDILDSYLSDGWVLGNGNEVKTGTREKLGLVAKGRKWMHHPDLQKNRRIEPEHVDTFLSLGWLMGYIKWPKVLPLETNSEEFV